MSEERNFEFAKLFCCLQAKSRNTLRLLSPDADGSFIIRSNLLTSDEAADFIKIYQYLTYSQYKLCSKKKPSSGLLFQTKWVCHLAEVENCPSEITIYVKKRSTVQKKRDTFLRLSPPLCAVIKINEQHNHSPKISKIPKETKLKKNAEINKVSTCDSGPHTCSRIDSAFISQEIKIEPVDEDYDSASVKIESSNNFLDYEETVYHQNEINVKTENNEEDDSTDFNQVVIHQRKVTVEIEETVQKVENCQNVGLSVSNSQENQLNGMNNRGSYNSHIKKRASHSKVSQKFSKNRNKHKSPKIVNCCSLNSRSQNNAMPSASVVTNSNSYYFSSTSVQTNNFVSIVNPSPAPLQTNNFVSIINPSPVPLQSNNFVSIINPSPVPLITNVTTNVNTNVVCQVQRAVSINNSHLTLYNPSSNTYTVVQLCTPASPNVSSSNIYSAAHFPNESPTRVGI